MKTLLIVNADDCNLTPGVTQAILDCHDEGILTSTTFMINLPVESKTIREIKKRKNLGVGIHLNVTLAEPVSKSSKIRSLLADGGRFKKLKEQLNHLPKAAELAIEYQSQIDLFKRIFARRATHLDTHHQVHGHPFFLNVLMQVAKQNHLPIRRSCLMPTLQNQQQKIKTTDFFFGNLTPEGYWRPGPLETVLAHLPEGVSEIMCHPGRNDSDLKKISSFTTGREHEYRLFSSPRLKKEIARLPLQPTHYGLCYT